MSLVTDYKRILPNHCKTMKIMLGFDRKERIAKNFHLDTDGYYDCVLLYLFMQQACIWNSFNCVHLAIVSASASYGYGNRFMNNKSSPFFGTARTTKTMIKKINKLASGMNDACFRLLSKKRFVTMLDNNQKGYNTIKQRHGSCNNFVVVCGRTFKKFVPVNVGLFFQRAEITYIEQAIPSPIVFVKYDNLQKYNDILCEYSTVRAICDINILDVDYDKPDFSGTRVADYIYVSDIADTCWYVIRKYLTGYKQSTDQYKR